LPHFFHDCFQPAEKGGKQYGQPQKHLCAAGGGKLTCPLFIVCYSCRLHPHTFMEGQEIATPGRNKVASVVPSSSGSYTLSPSSLKPYFCAVAAVAFGPCPAPSCRHCFRLVDCRFVRVANATSSASYSSPSLLRPHFVAVAAVAFGHCPAPFHHHCHCYCLVDCWCWMPIPHHQRHIRRCCC
jgi:hypothetical protein